MAFDAGMLAAVINEIKKEAVGNKVEKVCQPENDEIHLILHGNGGNRRLLINAGSNNPRISLSGTSKENPIKAPMFCMLLRKHFSGARFADIRQLGFERAAEIEFDAYDEMGYECKKYLIAEMMGKYSNLIFADENKKIVSALKIIGFSASEKRQILPGMIYEIPPKQAKENPLDCTAERFAEIYGNNSPDMCADKFICSNFLGISPLVAREIAYTASGHTDTAIGNIHSENLYFAFAETVSKIKNNDYTPSMVTDENGMPTEYSFTDIKQYGAKYKVKHFDGFGEMLDVFFETRDREQKIRQHASDISRLLTNAENRLKKKIDNQRAELEENKKGEKYKKQGDLITSNLHLLSKGMKKVKLVDYYSQNSDGTFPECEVTLDEKLTPAANAQRFYKLYNKSKNAIVEISEQLKIAEEELKYIATVEEALSKAECESDMNEIREELYHSGYASKMKNYTASKQTKPSISTFTTSNGYKVICGKNNTQNEYVTFKMSDKDDFWFHTKNVPGSHTVMLCEGSEPTEIDFTEAAEIAAYYSKARGGENIAVDYTKIKNIKKPRGTKPGFVTYSTNWTAYVTPSEEKIKKLKN